MKNFFRFFFCLNLMLWQRLPAEEPSSFRKPPCSESLSKLDADSTRLSLDHLDAILRHYSLQRIHLKHGLWVVDVNLESSKIPLAGHAVEVCLEIQEHGPFSARYEILPLKFSNGIVFGISDQKTKKVLEVILGRGFDEESSEAALFAQRLRGTEVPQSVIFKMGD